MKILLIFFFLKGSNLNILEFWAVGQSKKRHLEISTLEIHEGNCPKFIDQTTNQEV